MSATHCDNDQETNRSSKKKIWQVQGKGSSQLFMQGNLKEEEKKTTYKEIQAISHEGKKKLKKFKRQSQSIQIRIIYAQISGETLLYHN